MKLPARLQFRVNTKKHSPLPATRVHTPLSTTRPSRVPTSFVTALNSHLLPVAAPKADVVKEILPTSGKAPIARSGRESVASGSRASGIVWENEDSSFVQFGKALLGDEVEAYFVREGTKNVSSEFKGAADFSGIVLLVLNTGDHFVVEVSLGIDSKGASLCLVCSLCSLCSLDLDLC
jgi:hypothetical protein